MQLSFGTGRLFASPSGGTPVQFGALQGVSLSVNFATREAYGRNQFPIALYRGNARLTGRAEFAAISARVLSDVFFNVPATTGVIRTIHSEQQTIAANTVTVAHAACFVQDLGVVRADNGSLFERTLLTLDSPRGQQYACNESTGVYTFYEEANCVCTTANVLVSYTYQDSANGKSLSVAGAQQGAQTPFAMVLSETFNGKSLTLVLNACHATKLSLPFRLEDFTVTGLDFEASADANGVIGSLSIDDILPCQFTESFAQSLAPYGLVSGNLSLFSIATTSYGNTIAIASQAANFVSAISRSIPPTTANLVKVVFKLTSFGLDDAATLFMGTGNTHSITVLPRREEFFDANRSVQVAVDTETIFLTNSSVLIDTWYELTLTIAPGLGNTVATLRTAADGNLVNSVPFTQTHSPPLVSKLTFSVDSGGVTSATMYDEITVC